MNYSRANASQVLRGLTRFVLFAVATAMFYNPAVSASEDIERGTKNYMQFCQGCHGADKAGLVNFQGGLEDLQALLDGETSQMPDFYGVFSEAEVAEMYAYLMATDEPESD